MGEQLVAGPAYFIRAKDENPCWLWCSLVVRWRDRYNGGLTLQVCGRWRMWLGEIPGPCPTPGRLLHFPSSSCFNTVTCLPLAGTAATAGVDLRVCSASYCRDTRRGPGWRWQGQGGTRLPWKLHLAWDYF